MKPNVNSRRTQSVINVTHLLSKHSKGQLRYYHELDQVEQSVVQMELVGLEFRASVVEKQKREVNESISTSNWDDSLLKNSQSSTDITPVKRSTVNQELVSERPQATGQHDAATRSVENASNFIFNEYGEVIPEWDNPHSVVDLFNESRAQKEQLFYDEIRESSAYVLGLAYFQSERARDRYVLVSFRNCNKWDIKRYSQAVHGVGEDVDETDGHRHCERIIDEYISTNFSVDQDDEEDKAAGEEHWNLTVVLTKVPCRSGDYNPQHPNCFSYFQKDGKRTWAARFKSVQLVVWAETEGKDPKEQKKRRKWHGETMQIGINASYMKRRHKAEDDREKGSYGASSLKDLGDQDRLKIRRLVRVCDPDIRMHNAEQEVQLQNARDSVRTVPRAKAVKQLKL